MKPLAFILLLLSALALRAEDEIEKLTLVWDAPAEWLPLEEGGGVPFVYEIQETHSLVEPKWTAIITNLPAWNTNFVVYVTNKTFTAWRIRSVCATNRLWKSDFSNVTMTPFPSHGDGFGIYLGDMREES